MNSAEKRLILSLGIFFGWLLSIPFNGPLLFALTSEAGYNGISLALEFSAFHAAALLVTGIVVKRENYWRGFMFAGNAGCFLASLLALVLPTSNWFWLSALGGVFAAWYILGWSIPFTKILNSGNRMKMMAQVILLSNIILAVVTVALPFVTPRWLACVMLAMLALNFMNLPRRDILAERLLEVETTQAEYPRFLILILSLFILGLYINGGFMYRVIFPSFVQYTDIDVFFRLVPYIAALVVMIYHGHRVALPVLVYLAAVVMGLAFITFSLTADLLAGYFLTTILMQCAFALLDIFVFTIMGNVSAQYGKPFLMFGCGIFANVGAIVLGEVMGESLMNLGANYRLTTALFASAAIFLTIIIYPWLNGKLYPAQADKGLFGATRIFGTPEDSEPSKFAGMPAPSGVPDSAAAAGEETAASLELSGLTQREQEIVSLIVKGMANKDAAAKLFISESTLKTHLRNIYHKLGVTHKRELIARVRHFND